MSGKGAHRLTISPENSKEVVVLDYDRLKKAALVVSAINHPLRKQIIALLGDSKKITVTEIFKKIKTEQSVASQHLAVLRRTEILQAQRNGKFIHYFVNQKRLDEAYTLIDELAQKK